MLFHCLLQQMLRWVPFVVFSSLFVEVQTFWWVFPFQNVIASLSECVATVWVCVYIHWIKTSLKLSLALFCSVFYKLKMVRWVALRFVITLCWGLNCLKCDDQCFFLSCCNSCSACEVSFLTGKGCPGKYAHCRSPCPKKFFVYIHIH